MADADGVSVRTLSLPAMNELNPGDILGGAIAYDWSSDSDAIVVSFDVFVCDPSFSQPPQPFLAGLYILKRDGSPEEKLVDGPTHSPAWSPSGRYVAYVAQDYFGEVTEPPLLRLIDVTTRQVNDLGAGVQPAWQPLP